MRILLKDYVTKNKQLEIELVKNNEGRILLCRDNVIFALDGDELIIAVKALSSIKTDK